MCSSACHGEALCANHPFPSLPANKILAAGACLDMTDGLTGCLTVIQIVGLGVDAYLKMLLIDNFVHTDLHPGNIFVRSRSPAPEVPFSSYHTTPFTSAA